MILQHGKPFSKHHGVCLKDPLIHEVIIFLCALVTHLSQSLDKPPTQQPKCPPVWNQETNVVTLGTVMPAPACGIKSRWWRLIHNLKQVCWYCFLQHNLIHIWFWRSKEWLSGSLNFCVSFRHILCERINRLGYWDTGNSYQKLCSKWCFFTVSPNKSCHFSQGNTKYFKMSC